MKMHATRLLHLQYEDPGTQFVPFLPEGARGTTFIVQRARSVCQAIAFAHASAFDAILLDLRLADTAGLDAVARLRASVPSLPIIALADQEEPTLAIAAIQLGAQECLATEHMMGDLLARTIRHSITRQQQMQDALALALMDPLTGVGNRRAFVAELDRRFAEWRRYRAAFSVALFDIDHFKSINDSYGHDAGDQVLRHVASVLNQTTRDIDLVGRYGGEEFGILFPATRLDEAGCVAQRLRQVVADSVCGFRGQGLRITTSAGVAEITNEDDGKSVIRRADDALYAAKDAGRNCCLLHDGTSRITVA
jgi:diguanylate cyclase (GGDEF)-like protein